MAKADKIERQRGRYEDRVVTILKGKPGNKRGKVTIRDIGFVKTVPSSKVTPIDASEPGAVLRFEPPSP